MLALLLIPILVGFQGLEYLLGRGLHVCLVSIFRLGVCHRGLSFLVPRFRVVLHVFSISRWFFGSRCVLGLIPLFLYMLGIALLNI
jgi:hypothetical protein